MPRRSTLLLDLDGTLVDAFTTIHRAYCHVLPKFGLPEPSLAEVRRAVGGGLEAAMRRFLPEDRGRLVTAFLVGFFEQYVDTGFTASLDSSGTITVTAAAGDTDIMASVENIVGGSGNDAIEDFDSAGNRIDGGAGDDTVTGGVSVTHWLLDGGCDAVPLQDSTWVRPTIEHPCVEGLRSTPEVLVVRP